jgi:NAD(P) transhydrogenase subunit alpha
MRIAVPRETRTGERRVALDPSSVRKLAQAPVEVCVETEAGVQSGFPDPAYEAAGAKLVPSLRELCASADLVVRVQCPTTREVEALREGSALVALLQPYDHLDIVERLARRRITSFALDLMPRITRAQTMDVLSSMSTLAGYKAVLLAAGLLPRLFPMLMTAAGTIKPARVLVLGAGVAGLQAIATARRLGAVVEAFDVRPAAKEQVESLGARFVGQPSAQAEGAGGYAREQSAQELAATRELLARRIEEADAVICTALVPGRRAPLLVAAEQVKRMRPGSVVIDLAAEQGGNCELTQPGDLVRVDGVAIQGPLNVASSLPADASALFSRNVANYLAHLIRHGELVLDLADELTSGPLVTRGAEIVHPQVRQALGATPA